MSDGQTKAAGHSSSTSAPKLLKRLKGGSLGATCLMEDARGLFIRKSIRLDEEREYGFVRWHSQLKRLQRFGELFPGTFPNVIGVGRDGENAFFDLEYVENSRSGFEFLARNPSDAEVDRFFAALTATMEPMHSRRRQSCRGALDLYLHEEFERPLRICQRDPAFAKFALHASVVFNGREVPSIMGRIDEAYELVRQYYREPWECYTHGNLTLENTLWDPAEDRVWFVDPYEENIADTVHNEYSQILQSSHSLYEFYNSVDAHVEGNAVSAEVPRYASFDRFNENFEAYMRERMSPDDLVIVRLYEVSQFTRMLPFKMHVAKEKMIVFYALASSLFDQLLQECQE